MQLGDFELHSISGGRFRIDGGTMFGVVPKPLWVRHYPAAEDNTILQESGCLLVKTGKQTVLIDTGYGTKMSERRRAIFAAEPGTPLETNLLAHGVSATDVDVVILSHLHFDHAGGATKHDESGEIVPTFPRAEYIVQRVEWEIATADLPELRGAYPSENFLALKPSGQLRLIDGDVEILPGFRARVTGGHTVGHHALYIENGGETAVFLGDICPTSRHLPTLWCMSYDVDLLQTRRIKPRILGEIADNGWLALFDHDPDRAAARLERKGADDFAVAEGFATL